MFKRRHWIVLLVIPALIAAFAGGYIVRGSGDDVARTPPGADCSEYSGGETKPKRPPPRTVVRYAPVVFLHPGEPYWPMPVDCFLAKAQLDWARRQGRTPETAGEVLDAKRLGHGQYHENEESEACLRPKCLFDTDDFTRPYDEKRVDIRGRPGFYLDVEDPYRGGAESTRPGSIFAGTPVYYDYLPRRYVTYWFFYGFSEPFGQLKLPPQAKAVGHEGDWERISIRLGRADQATDINYYAHHGAEPYTWASSAVTTLDDHPIVFSALKSHASYPDQGPKKSGFDRAAPGLMWLTWYSLKDVRCAPWFGFGGAWGTTRAVPNIVRGLARRVGFQVGESEFTGPLGPSGYKPPAPSTWVGSREPPRCRQ
jgi:hypothetical protein